MPETNIASASVSDLTNTMTSYSVASSQTDGVLDQDETEWQMTTWQQYLGYYRVIPELKMAVNALTRWTIGKGWKASELTSLCLMRFQGFGKESFNSIMANLFRTMVIAGDSFAEIIRDDDGMLVNLKPLDPSTIKVIVNKKGIIKRYEQTNKTTKTTVQKFQPEEIFHLCRDRVADEIHGNSMVEALVEIILARNEAIADWKKVLHRNVSPVRIWHIDSDDETKINQFKAKVQNMKDKFEDIFIPKGAVVPEISSVPPNATLSATSWIQLLTQYFFQLCGVPQIVVGGSQEMTEATAKIAYLAFEQTIEEGQLYIEEQVLSQLNLLINLEFPASLKNEVLAAQKKQETMQAATPEDTSVRAM